MLENVLLTALQKQNLHQDISQDQILSWVQSKKIKSTDLTFLNILKTDNEKKMISECFLKCFSLNASFSETLQILELATELVMINSETAVLTETTNINTWKSELKKLRYPQTTLSDQELKAKLEALPWPYGAKVKFERRGDRAGIEVKLFISSTADLTKSISALERVKEQI
jgi:hypothetical protein